jgi:serine/threonine protein kinase
MAPLPNNITSLPYTAPEIILSARHVTGTGPCALASAAADMWALGIIAFELLTNTSVFPVGSAPEDIRAALSGQTPLPWEEGVEGAEEQRKKLRGLRRIVMPCLDRDPSKRPAAEQVLQSWWHLFDEMKTQGTFDSNCAQAGESTHGDPLQPNL